MPRLKSAWMSVKQWFCFRHVPRIVNWLIHLSTHQARQKLTSKSLTILMDVNVRAHGVTHETQWVTTRYSNFWKHPLGGLARVPVHASDCESDVYKSVQFLPSIAHLARRGFLTLSTSLELQAEEYRLSAARLSGGGLYDYNVFEGIRPRNLDTSTYGGFSFEELSNKESQRQRLDRSTDELYRALVSVLGPKMSQDAWHIRTAELHGCFCFLTMDFKLIRKVDAVRHLEPFTFLTTQVMTPADLGKILGITPIPPIFLSYHDASFSVRPDLHQPHSERFRAPKQREPSPN